MKNNLGNTGLDCEFFAFMIKMCDNSTSSVVCAPFGDNYELLYEYLERHELFIFKTTNYIDYDEVDPFKGPLKRISEIVSTIEL